ncbi:MAG: Crp/Fnr family transcriptional regulator [Nitrospiraceae bacterium]|nr:MAG: Crp/Fnr family transcriptional regulator [Nitrospiraceae bacterium]
MLVKRSNADILDDLRVLPCLSGLKKDELSSIGGQAHIRSFVKNEILFRESEQADFLFVVKKGQVKLFKTSSEGRELSIKIMGRHEYFCCAPLYHDGKYPVSASAKENSSVVVIPSKEFKDVIGFSTNEIGLKIIKGLCNRIKYLSGLVENLSFRDVEQRILMALLRLSEEKAPMDNIVSLSISHNDIASITGTVREVVSRIMSRLKKEGTIVDSNVRGFKINKDRLKNIISKK